MKRHKIVTLYNYEMLFRSQYFTMLINEVKYKLLVINRIKFSKKQRFVINENNNGWCNKNASLDINHFHIDHINSLAERDLNDIDILQQFGQDNHCVKPKEENQNRYTTKWTVSIFEIHRLEKYSIMYLLRVMHV